VSLEINSVRATGFFSTITNFYKKLLLEPNLNPQRSGLNPDAESLN
jgi:hypothetical protein